MRKKTKNMAATAKKKARSLVQWYSRRRGSVHGWAHILVPLALLLALVFVRVSGWSWVEMLQHRSFD